MRTKWALISTTLATLIISTTVIAGTNPWSYTNYDAGTFVPRTGDFAEGIVQEDYWTKVWFVLDSSNISSISNYNKGLGKGGSCSGKNAYLTLDVRAVDNGSRRLDAYSIYTTIPNPKVDLESNGLNSKNDESEVVSLGGLKAGYGYYMRTYWDDSRSGSSSHSGTIYARFAMSNKGFSDYNNCTNAAFDQVVDKYGKDYNSL